MAILTQSATYTRNFLMVDSTDHITGKTGLTVTVTLSKAGGSFGAAGGTVTEISSGWYKIALTTTDTNTVGDLAYHCTSTGADPTDFTDQVTAGDLANLNASISAVKAKTDNLPEAVQKNQALNNFMFLMVKSSNHVDPKTGLTVTATRSIDGGAFAACTNSVTEVSNGWYKINLSASDLNGTIIALNFSAATADDRNILIKTAV